MILFNIEIKYMELKYRGRQTWRYCLVYIGKIRSFNRFVLSDCVLWLGRRRSAQLFKSDSSFGSENVFFEKTIADELFQLLLEVSTLDNFVPLTVVVRAVFLLLRRVRDRTGLVLNV